MGNYHVRFCSGGGAGDRPTDHSEPDAAVATNSLSKNVKPRRHPTLPTKEGLAFVVLS